MSIRLLLRFGRKEITWMEYAFDFSTHMLRLSLPANESSEYPPGRVVNIVNPRDPKIYRNAKGAFTVLEKFWDYPAGFMKGVAGTAKLTILIKPISEEICNDLNTVIGLMSYLDRRGRLHAEQWKRDNPKHPPHIPPKKYEKATMGGAEWVKFRYDGKGDSHAYAAPLDKSFYLQLQFGFIDNDRGLNTGWRPKASALEEKILATVKLEPR